MWQSSYKQRHRPIATNGPHLVEAISLPVRTTVVDTNLLQEYKAKKISIATMSP